MPQLTGENAKLCYFSGGRQQQNNWTWFCKENKVLDKQSIIGQKCFVMYGSPEGQNTAAYQKTQQHFTRHSILNNTIFPEK